MRTSPGARAPMAVGGKDHGLSPQALRSVIGPGGSDSVVTVLVALGANLLVAVAKSVAAVVTGSASLTAEAAHS